MPQKKQTKLEIDINELIIVNNKKLTPYIELVNFSSKNIDQKKLGTILGIFEIKDTSEDSAYIVNFLSSVAKKTYFASHQKNPENGFENTLAKVNLSLSEVAKHGNVNWIGKVDAVLCCVFENQIHFSVSGDAKVLLLRKDRLTEISAGLSPIDEAANPLKTFTDIASGRLEDGDKLILTTDDISHIFTLEDLEKHALSFNNSKFIRFLKTALINELDIAGTIVIDAKKVTKKIKEKTHDKKEDVSMGGANLFGNTAFEKNKKREQETFGNKIPSKEQKEEYIHEQTGHIYIKDSKEENYESLEENKFEKFLDLSKEKLSDFLNYIKEKFFKKINYKIKKQISSLFEKKLPKKKILPSMPSKISTSNNIPSIPIPPLKTKDLASAVGGRIKYLSSYAKKQLNLSLIKKPLAIINGTPIKMTSPDTADNFITIIPRNNFDGKVLFKKIRKKTFKFTRIISRKILAGLGLLKNLLPRFVMLKNIFLQMNLKLKMIVLAVIILIFTAPFLFLKSKDDSNSQIANQSVMSENNTSINPSSQSYREVEELHKDPDILGTFVFNNIIFAISKNRITKIGENTENYNFPDNFKNAICFSFMNDLNLLFLINDKNQLISFSPISLKFKNDNIIIKEDASIEGMGTYLTYLYLVDSKNKQIYRYPRAEEGFGEKIDWLASDISLEDISDVAIDGNLYLAKKDTVLKLFNRKSQDFNLKKDANSSINGIFTNEDTSNIYILDNLNGELIKYDKSGNKINSTSNNSLTRAKKIWVNEKESVSYFVTSDTLFKIKLSE